jgi:hypothetical protein
MAEKQNHNGKAKDETESQRGFFCPGCLVPLRVIDTMPRDKFTVNRKRQCPLCLAHWITVERLAFPEKANGQKAISSQTSENRAAIPG